MVLDPRLSRNAFVRDPRLVASQQAQQQQAQHSQAPAPSNLDCFVLDPHEALEDFVEDPRAFEMASFSFVRDPRTPVAHPSFVADPRAADRPGPSLVVPTTPDQRLLAFSEADLEPLPVASATSAASSRTTASALLERTQRAWIESLEQEMKSLFSLFEEGMISEVEFRQSRTALLKDLPVTSPLHPDFGNETSEARPSSTSAPTMRASSSSSTAASQKRAVRVFLSSTFLDMQTERDVLVKKVFPEIKNICGLNGISFTEIDLRWGITAEQAERGETVAVCMREIDNCRPYFVNILGSRYGWVPTAFAPELRAAFPFLNSIAPGSASVTEIEIRYALHNRQSGPGPLFFLRQGAEAYDDSPNLAALRALVRGSGSPCSVYSDVLHLGDLVRTQLLAAIGLQFVLSVTEPAALRSASVDAATAQQIADKQFLLEEQRAHDAFAESISRVFVAPTSNALSTVFAPNSTPAAVIAPSGAGKSAFLAALGPQDSPSAVVLSHHAGCSPSSTEPSQICRRIMLTMKEKFGIAEDVPSLSSGSDVTQVYRACARWLESHVPSGQRFCLVLDGLDAVQNDNGAEPLGSLTWLPLANTSNFQLVVSCTPEHPATQTILRRGWRTAAIPVLSKPQRRDIASTYMSLYSKTLTEAQLVRISEAPQTSSPLFLTLLIAECRVHGKFEEIDAVIEGHLRTPTPSTLFSRVLSRLEADFNTAEYPTLVRDTFAVLFVARNSLRSIDVAAALGVPLLLFSPLHHALVELGFGSASSDVLVLRNTDFREVVRQHYVSHFASMRYYRLKIATCFLRGADTKQRAHEVAWQLWKCGPQSAWELRQLLLDFSVFRELFDNDRQHLKLFWNSLKAEGYDIADSLIQSLESVRQDLPLYCDRATIFARFLRELQLYDPAEALLKIVHQEELNGLVSAKDSQTEYYLAQINWNQGRWAEAEKYGLLCLAKRQQQYGAAHPKVGEILTSLGEVHFRWTCTGYSAEDELKRAIAIFEAQPDGKRDHRVSRCLHNLGHVSTDRGEFQQALDLHFRAIAIREATLGPLHPQLGVSWEVLGSTYQIMRDSSRAALCMRRALKINVLSHSEMNVQVASCCYWMKVICASLGQHAAALRYEERYQRITTELERRGVDVRERVVD
eukprot:TRINITY_DN861_c0_g1_i1.p1 TRINITY_DN861_c0_g1~~TRINITY_DN861_c0_g1_i1.p1  ORF type:complete len:1137 (-),score=238.54 TRINITY_DN861_c0_g1_i1:21-3431(-)